MFILVVSTSFSVRVVFRRVSLQSVRSGIGFLASVSGKSETYMCSTVGVFLEVLLCTAMLACL